MTLPQTLLPALLLTVLPHTAQAGPELRQCQSAQDCKLVQESYCGSVFAIFQRDVKQWTKDDLARSDSARREKQTCKPSDRSASQLESYRVECELGQCRAKRTD